MDALVALLLIGAFALLGFHFHKKKQEKKRMLLGWAAAELDAPLLDAETGKASGKSHGLEVVFHLTSRGSGSDAVSWTEVDVEVSSYGLSIDLRPQTKHEEKLHGRGLVVDLTFDDDPFDQAFIVEAAPADVVQILLDEAIRERLLALEPVELSSRAAGLQLAKEGWIEDHDEMVEMIDLVATIGSQLEPAYRQADRAAEPTAETAYRGEQRGSEQLRQRAKKQLARQRQDEVAEVASVKQQRKRHQSQQQWAAIVIFLIVSLAAWLLVR